MFKFNKLWALALLFTLVFTLTGCSPAPATAPQADATTTEKTATATTYPLTLNDGGDVALTFEKAPVSVVSLSPSATEIIFAIGKGDLLKGRTDYCNFPAEAAAVPSVGSITEPNLELLAAAKPDVVFISDMFSSEVKAKIEALGIKVFDLSSHDSFEGVYTALENAGVILDAQEAATTLTADMKSKVADVQNKVKDLPKVDTYYVVGFGEYGDFTAGKGTFIDQMIGMAGGNNVAQDAEGWKYSLEKLIEKDPELMICSKFFDTKAGILAANGYKDLTAVKNGKLMEIDNDQLDRQGPRSADGLLELAKIIHPEAFK